jgi:hypothetical protein
MTGFSNKGGCLPFLAKYNYSESCSFFPMHGMGQTVRGCINLHYLANARCHLETHAVKRPISTYSKVLSGGPESGADSR